MLLARVDFNLSFIAMTVRIVYDLLYPRFILMVLCRVVDFLCNSANSILFRNHNLGFCQSYCVLMQRNKTIAR